MGRLEMTLMRVINVGFRLRSNLKYRKYDDGGHGEKRKRRKCSELRQRRNSKPASVVDVVVLVLMQNLSETDCMNNS